MLLLTTRGGARYRKLPEGTITPLRQAQQTGHGAQRRVPRAVDRVVTGAVLALVAGGVPEPIGGFAGGLVLVLCTRVSARPFGFG